MKAFAAASQNDFWPSPFPSIGNNSVRPELTGKIRQKRHSLNLNNLEGLDGEHISRAVVLLPKARERAGTISLEIEGGPLRGIHQCEILGRGATALTQQPGWVSGAIQEAAGTKTKIYYAPKELENGATIPGIYDLRNIRPNEY